MNTEFHFYFQSIIRKLKKEVVPFADRIMTTLLSLFTSATKHSTTLEDGFLAVGAITTGMSIYLFLFSIILN
jgi:importin subunit beta-1